MLVLSFEAGKSRKKKGSEDSLCEWLSYLRLGVVAEEDTLQYMAREVVILEGTPVDVTKDNMYFVLKGSLRVAIAGIPVRELKEGDHFGELALL